MPKQYWMVKQEPEEYSWEQFVKDGCTSWVGVRNYQARNNLRAMIEGDSVFYYHSVTGKEVVGIAKVARKAYPDTTAEEGDWSAVDLIPFKTLKRTITLEMIKQDEMLRSIPLIKQSRLSVIPLSEAEFKRLMQLADTKP